MRERERFNQRDRRGRDHRPSHRIRGGDNHKFGRRGNNIHTRRKIFNDQRRQFNNPHRRREKLSQEKLNDELDNYFTRKGGESLKDYLDNDLEMYQNNAKMNENLEKEKIELPKENEEKKETKVEEPKEEPKKEEENKVEEKEQKQEMDVEEKKVEKKKKGRGKK